MAAKLNFEKSVKKVLFRKLCHIFLRVLFLKFSTHKTHFKTKCTHKVNNCRLEVVTKFL